MLTLSNPMVHIPLLSKFKKMFIVITLTMTLFVVLIIGFSSFPSPQVTFLPATPLHNNQQPSDDDLEIRAFIESPGGNGAVAILGERITYTIVLTNVSTAPFTITEIVDLFTKDAFEEVVCSCTIITVSTPITIPVNDRLPDGVSTVKVRTVRLVWPLGLRLEINQRYQITFSAELQNLLDGDTLNNRVLVSYLAGIPKQAVFDTSTPVTAGQVEGRLSQPPIWRSEEIAGINDIDWGDFDHDGDLDLALASDLGIFVYQNNEGKLVKLWSTDRFAYSVRWGDFHPDSKLTLELVAAGESNGIEGINYVYEYLPQNQSFGLISKPFISTDALFHIETVKATKTSPIQLIGLTFCTGCENSGVYLFEPNGQGSFIDNGTRINNAIPWSAAVGNFDNNDGNEVALINSNRYVVLFHLDSLELTLGPLLPSNVSIIEDMDAGDFDGDGKLDLILAAPYNHQVLIYTNPTLTGDNSNLPLLFDFEGYTADWGDFNSDDKLDFASADFPPKVYLNTGNLTEPFTTTQVLNTQGIEIANNFAWFTLNPIDLENDGDLDLSVGNYSGQSVLIANFTPPLSAEFEAFETENTPATSVAWGDVNGDSYLDLLIGAGTAETNLPTSVDAKLYLNASGILQSPDDPLSAPLRGSGGGPQVIAWADFNRDKLLEIAMGGGNKPLRIYKDLSKQGVSLQQRIAQEFSTLTDVTALAWGDMNGDGDLDLAIGRKSAPVIVLRNLGALLSTDPITVSTGLTAAADLDTTSVAWGDFDWDHHMDLAIGKAGQPTQIFRNQGDNSFRLFQRLGGNVDTRTVAWVDYDQDGDFDLSVGNYGDFNWLYSYDQGSFTQGITISNQLSKTTSIAWGDIDGDSDPDLAVGNDNEQDQIFINLHGTLVERWQSREISRTTGVAWGDMDNDGDLDLAISQNGNGRNGIYENFYVSPSHLTEDYAKTMPLTNQPSYVSIARPGVTPNADDYTSPEILSGPQQATVTIPYRFYDPDGSRQLNEQDAQGDGIISSTFEYSLDGGGNWHRATQAGNESIALTTTRLGYATHFLWNAVADQAISDNARFRITIIHDNPYGPVQRAATSAISPPFRVRGTTCYWPIDPVIRTTPSANNFSSLTDVVFTGAIAEGSGVIQFIWNAYDSKGNPIAKEARGQRIRFSSLSDQPDEPILLQSGESYAVTLRVAGAPCPITRPVSTTQQLYGPLQLFLPWIAVTNTQTSASVASVNATPALSIHLALPQVTGVSGSQQPETGIVTLQWDPYAEPQRIQGYHVYREQRDSPTAGAELLATLGPDATTLADLPNRCSSIYYITAYNAAGESLPSTSSYYTWPCR